MDEFVVQQLSDLSDENSERFKEILEIKIEEVLEKSHTAQEYTILKRKKEKLQTDIVAQTRNLREADDSIKCYNAICYIQEDIQTMSEELRETERLLFKLDKNRKSNMTAIRDLEQTKERLVTLIQSIIERIYIVDKDDERFCHIFIKGCTGEDYTGFFQTASYIESENMSSSTPMCDSEQYCIYSQV